jgi:light-regulated signal transduction histidine kinase (bacteriophytochrome)
MYILNGDPVDKLDLEKKGITDYITKDELPELNLKIIRTVNENIDLKKVSPSEMVSILKNEMELISKSMSHDVRAPLRAIDGYLNMIEEDYNGTLDENLKRLLREVQANAKKIKLLTTDLLTFSRIVTREINCSDVNVAEIVEEVILDMKSAIPEKVNISIGDLHLIKADTSLIFLLFQQLIDNAIKFSSAREYPLIEISSEENEESIIFKIKDNGVGFDMKYADKLFVAFRQLHDPMEFDGTGIGLAIVDRIMAKHDGDIWVEATPNHGATFYCSFPKKID